MTDVVSQLHAAVDPSLGINPWGMLGCALTYAAAMFAAVDGIADHLIRRPEAADSRAVHALRLKMGAKIAAAAIAVLTAAIVLIIDHNWVAFGILSVLFVLVVLWVFYVYREGSRSTAPR
jgi:ABC-type multidrug transport system fused ATPase/permease subunit